MQAVLPKSRKSGSCNRLPQEADFEGRQRQRTGGSACRRPAKDGYDFSVGIPLDTPISRAERVVSAGKGIGSRENMKLIEALAVQAGAAVGSSRPVAETLKYVPLNRYVGMSGQKFTGNLYIACGISGAVQHLKGNPGRFHDRGDQ